LTQINWQTMSGPDAIGREKGEGRKKEKRLGGKERKEQ